MLDFVAIHELARQTLEASGWRSDRKIGVSASIAQLTLEGYHTFQYAEAVLSSFAGIACQPASRERIAKNAGEFRIDPMELSGEHDRLKYVEACVGEQVFPLGTVYAQWFLFVGHSKRIYMVGRTEIYRLADRFEDFINNIILGNYEPVLLAADA